MFWGPIVADVKIRTKLAVALLIVTFVLGSGVVAGLEVFKDRETERMRTDVDRTANRTAGQINAVFRERENTVRYYASRPRAANFSRSGPYLRQFVDSTRFYAARLIAKNGTVLDYRGQISEAGRQQVIGTNVNDAAYAESVLSGEFGIYTSEVEHVPENDWNVVVISAPVFDPETEEITGAIAAVMRVGDGDLFVPAKPLETDRQTVSVNTTVDGSAVTLHESESNYENSIDGTATVDATGWTVRVSHDRSPLTAQLRGLAIAQGVGLLVILGLVGGLGWYEYVTNLRQTERLLEGFDRLQRGEYDYTMSLTSAEEWQQISDGYNDLSMGLEQREREIRESEQRLEVLNRVLRHNLRNDMNVILTYAEMLPDLADGPRIEKASETILRKGRGLISHGKKARQIEEAMESADAGTATIDAASTVERIVDDHRDAYDDVTFETDLPTTAAASAISSFGLAVENLVENAARHNDSESPSVEVAVTKTADTVEIAVRDDGPGIPDHEYEVLSEGQETALEHGSGVGLWLSHWVVGKSNGDMRFADREPTGTEVTIELAAGEETIEPDEDDAFSIDSVLDGAGDGEDDPDSAGAEAGADDAVETPDEGASEEAAGDDDPLAFVDEFTDAETDGE